MGTSTTTLRPEPHRRGPSTDEEHRGPGLHPNPETRRQHTAALTAKGLISTRLASLREEAEGPVSPIGEASMFHAPHQELLGLDPVAKIPLGAAARAFVRDPEERVAPEYLELHLRNLTAAHERVFLPALKDGSLFRDFLGTLRRQQVVLMEAEGGVYTGMTGKTPVMALQAARDPNLYQPPVRHRPHPGELLSEVRIRFGNNVDGNQIAFAVTADILARLNVRFDRAGKVELPGIPAKAQPTLSLGFDARYTGPKIKYLPLYLDQMALNLERALKSVDQPRALQHLADYLQVASNTHLFPRGNNSMFMSHVNFALERMGLNPIAHDVLDVWAYVLDSKDFRPLFYRAVEAANPGVTWPPGG